MLALVLSMFRAFSCVLTSDDLRRPSRTWPEKDSPPLEKQVSHWVASSPPVSPPARLVFLLFLHLCLFIVPSHSILAFIEKWRQYMTQLREELGVRLIERYYTSTGLPNKFWACFTKRKFLNKVMR